ncbi:MAG TPA: S8 family serine peptidase [Pyrinomonadaceae bacterium]|jgi:subtilisin family serine protease
MNKSQSSVAACLILLLFVCSIPAASQTERQSLDTAANAQKRPMLNFVPGEILVRFRNESQAKTAERSTMSMRSEGRSIQIRVTEFKGAELVEGLRLAHVAAEDTLQAIADLNSRPDVLYAEPNYVRRINKLPNDPRFPEMWGLKNTGQPNGNGNPGFVGADIDAELAWNTTTGNRNVVVGVVDEGIDINHQDLKDNIWQNPVEIAANGVDDDGNGFVDDVNGWDFYHNDNTVFDSTGNYPTDETDAHGTHVAGTIGATGNNGTGVVGVNWQVSLMSLKILGPDGGSSAGAISAYNYAGKMRELWDASGGTKGANIRVLNNSYGGIGYSQAEVDAIRALGGKGILFVVSAGNEGGNNDVVPAYPSSYIATNLISVAATDRRDNKASFSNFGAGSVNMAAPGVEILSTTPNNTYSVASGTSMAAPHVSGAAALVCAAFPSIGVRRLRAALMYSGEINFNDPYYKDYSSARRLNVANALLNAASVDSTPPAAPTVTHVDSQWYQRSINIWFNTPGDDGNTGKATGIELRLSDTEINTPEQFDMARPLPGPVLPNTPGTSGVATVTIPWRHSSGFLALRFLDEAGNAGPFISVPYQLGLNTADPYMMGLSAPSALSTGGTPLGLVGDDVYKTYTLPSSFRFFGTDSYQNSVTVSTNGALYFGYAPNINNQPDDAISSDARLNAFIMVAGLWDDLRTDRRAGDDVYVVQPDAGRIIFRWQAVTYDTPLGGGQTRGEHPVNFEIELRRDNGGVVIRYGDGNQSVLPVVGISGGYGPDAYVATSHTSPYAFKDLTNAATVNFALRAPTPPPVTPTPTPEPTPTPTPVPTPIPGLSGRVVFSGPNLGGLPDQIFVMNADGTNLSMLTGVPSSYCIMPEWSPDGKKIAFTKDGHLHIMNEDGSNLKQITNSSSPDFNPSWSPDGSKVLTNSDGQMRIISVDNGNQVTIGGDLGYEARFSPDGTKILYDNALGNSQLWVMNTDGSNRTQLTNITGSKVAARWSPDGKKIAFANYGVPTTATSEIYVMNADGSGLTRITTGAFDSLPTWSPDGSMIMFVRSDKFYVMNADGTNPQYIYTTRTPKNISWKANSSAPSPNTVRLSASTYRESEGAAAGIITISVQRFGDTSNAASVDYYTSDQAGLTPCQNNQGLLASDRCDYATAIGTVRFAPGEQTKTTQIPIINDSYAEPTQTFSINLRNAQGVTLADPVSATVSILDDDPPAQTSNPINTNSYFINQQYVDYLGRVPEPAGYQFWLYRLYGYAPNCMPGEVCDRVDTAKRFFESDEFRERGFYVYKLYDALLGRFPLYAEFVPEVARLNGPQTVTEQRLGKDAYLLDFMNKPEFKTLFEQYLTADHLHARDAASAAAFVDALCQKAGITPASRASLIANLQNGTRDPAHTLEDFILTPEINGDGTKFYDRARIVMQYFGFLRRDPDTGGFNFWWNRVATSTSPQYHDYRELVNNFLRSDEYNFRFAFIPAP